MNGLAESVDQISIASSDRQRRMPDRMKQRWLLLLIFVGMACLQIELASRQALWVDETFSLAMATGHSLEHPAASARPELGDFVEYDQPVAASQLQRCMEHEYPRTSLSRVIRAVLLSDTSPPLYYIMLYFWTLILGTSDIALRLFSISCWLACFPFLALIARRVGGRNAVIPACLFFAVSPVGLYFSGEGRMYALFLLCVVVTAWASLRLHQRNEGLAINLIWILASAAGFLTHYFFVFPWLAFVAFLILQPGKVAWQRLLLCSVIVGVAILPWYLLAISSGHHWRVTEGWLHGRPDGFSRSHAIRNDFLQFFSGGGFGLWRLNQTLSVLSLAMFAILAAALAWRFHLRMFTGRRLLLILWFGAVCSAPTVIDLVQHTYLSNIPRYTLAALPAAMLLAAIGFSTLAKRAALIVLPLILLLAIPPIVKIYRLRARTGEPFRAISKAVDSNGNSSDLIIVHSIPSGVLGVARYVNGSTAIASWVGQLHNRRVPDSLRTLIAGRARVLLVKVHEVDAPAPEESWLRANAVVYEDKWIEAANIVEFRPKGAERF